MIDGTDLNGDGQREMQTRMTWTYDENGQPIRLLTETDLDGDGTYDESREEEIGDIIVDEWVLISEDSRYDDQGRLTFQDLLYDTNGDGIGDYRTIDQTEYSSDGLTIRQHHQEDIDADGAIDYQYWMEQQFDEAGRLIVSTDGWDGNGDGQRDSQTRSTWTYDENGNAIHLLSEMDVDGDGTYDESYEEYYDPYSGDPPGGGDPPDGDAPPEEGSPSEYEVYYQATGNSDDMPPVDTERDGTAGLPDPAATLNFAAGSVIASAGDVASSFTGNERDVANLNDPVIENNLRLAGSAAVMARQTDNSDRDEFFGSFGRDRNSDINYDATSILSDDIEGEFELD
jgi:hypothetical protein